jgi:hypothetical protein
MRLGLNGAIQIDYFVRVYFNVSCAACQKEIHN